MNIRPRFWNIAFTVALAASGFGCSSSSSSSDAADAGKPDVGTDVPKDVPKDMATGEVPEGIDASDGGGPVLSAAAMRGQYLVNSVIGCSDCHTPTLANGMPDLTMFLAGNENFIVLPNGDKLPTRNLTNDPTGLMNRTDDEIKTMFLSGMRPAATAGADAGTGTALNPVMPYYVFHNMTSDDADAIVAYLRTVKGVAHMIPNRSASFDVPAPAPALNLNSVKSPNYADYDTQQSALRGKYLTTQVGLCVECHTKHLLPGAATVLDEANLLAGGEDFSSIFATTLMIHPVSKNLTGDNDTGLGTWTAMDVQHCLSKGQSKDGTGICPPMPLAVYMTMTMQDQTDIANYIKSLPPIVHSVPDMCVFPIPADGGADGAADGGADAGDSGAPDTEADAGVDGGDDTGG